MKHSFRIGERVSLVSFETSRMEPLLRRGFVDKIDGSLLHVAVDGQECRVITNLKGVNSLVNARVLFHGENVEIKKAVVSWVCEDFGDYQVFAKIEVSGEEITE